MKNGETGIITTIKALNPYPVRKNPAAGQRLRRHKWGFQKRLEDMGATPGTEITVINSAPFHGPVEIRLRGYRLAIGRGMAKRILVEVKR